MVTGKNYIGNRLSAKGYTTYKTFNPLLNIENQVVFTEATSEEIDEAVLLAAEAFKTFRTVSGLKKADFLNTIADEILALGDKLIQTYCAESGLDEHRCISERTRTIGLLRSFAGLVKEGSWIEASIDTAMPERKPIPKPDLRKMLIPLGPVVVFGASNFPLAYSTAGGDSAAAFAAGCPVIVKSHPMHSGTGELVASAIVAAVKKTGMPNGVFSNLNSSGISVGEQLVKHAAVKAVGFTGSIKGGRALYDMAAKREEPIPVFAEMGSVNPVVLLPSALKNKTEAIAKMYATSITTASGQFCTNPGLLLGVKGKHLSDFIQKLSDVILEIEPSCMLHPHIFEAYEKKKTKAMAQAELQVAAKYEGVVPTNFARQTLTTVCGKTFLRNPTLHQEVFGPYSIIVQCENIKELEAIILNLEGQLTGTIISDTDDELSEYPSIVAALQNRVGRLIFNGVPTGVEVCPSMVHGGPYPASSDSRFTAVGINSIKRWVRPFSYQEWPNQLLPEELKNENPLGLSRVVNNKRTTERI
ncbi:aldehyde dehydrogenase (NADP(+)) [Mariniflexile ostreae]|uniref:Aldehyde dehydrogenase (NADP(+)) n=1 Tax=Mariniflexile ostreae TaxID=1520892 RepID=A0ABV5FA16_9FLAO